MCTLPLLEGEAHHTLAEKIREVRQGVAGVNYSMLERLGQGDEQLSQGRELVDQGRSAIRQRTTAERQRDIGLSLLSAGIYQRRELIDLGEQSLDVQRRIARDLSSTRVLAETSLGVQREAALDLSSIRGLAERAEVDRGAIVSSTGATAENTGLIAGHTADLVDAARIHGAQMDDAQVTRGLQLDIARQTALLIDEGNTLLGNIDTRLEGLGEVAVFQAEKMVEAVDTLRVMNEIGSAQLRVGESIHGALIDLGIVFEAEFDATREVIREVAMGIQGSIRGLVKTLRELGETKDQRSADEAFRRGLKWMKFGRIDRALKALDLAESRWDLDPRVFFNRGLCYVTLDDAAQARKDFKTTLLLVSKDSEGTNKALIELNLARLAYSEAKIYLKQGRNEQYEEKLLEAIARAKSAVDKIPDSLDAKLALAVYLAAFNLLDKAFEVLVDVLVADVSYVSKIESFDPLKVFSAITSANNAHVSLLEAVIAYGDSELTSKTINKLIKNVSASLNEGRIWEMAGFELIQDEIARLLKKEIEESNSLSWQNWYAIASIALRLPKLNKRDVYTAFYKGATNDPAFLSKDPSAIKAILVAISSDAWDKFREVIIRKYPENFPWLINNL